MKLGDNFFETIFNAIRRSGVMIVVLTPAYLEAKHCAEELQAFVDQHAQDLLGRIFIVEPVPPRDDEVVPEVLRDFLRYRFWVVDKTGRPRMYGLKSARFRDEIENLGQDIVSEFRKRRPFRAAIGVGR